ncbi:MAG: hypothetical protein Phog2KO_41670 [Phototrophicaceae bacterium]
MYYPEQRPIAELMRIKRRTMLPDYAIGSVRAELGSIVDVREKVARGIVPARYVIIEASNELGVSHDELLELLAEETNQPIAKGTFIAGRDPERGKRIFAPLDGLIAHVADGRIIMQATPEIIELEAGVRGQVIQVVAGRGITVEATGGIIQGIWGNDRHVIAPLRFEPNAGLENIDVDDIDPTYRGDIIITKTPLTAQKIAVAQSQSFAGIIAPSMDANLVDNALNSPVAIMLLTDFGVGRITSTTLHILETYEGSEAVLDATYPHRFDDRRAELIVNKLSKEDMPSGDAVPLSKGLEVRITRAPYAGRTGKVVQIPTNKVRLPNGLRVFVAKVEVGVDEIVDVPLANLELTGT